MAEKIPYLLGYYIEFHSGQQYQEFIYVKIFFLNSRYSEQDLDKCYEDRFLSKFPKEEGWHNHVVYTRLVEKGHLPFIGGHLPLFMIADPVFSDNKTKVEMAIGLYQGHSKEDALAHYLEAVEEVRPDDCHLFGEEPIAVEKVSDEDQLELIKYAGMKLQ